MYTTYDTNNVLTLNNGNKICKFCGKNIKYTRNYNYGDREDYSEYECDCSDWKKYFEIEDNLREINNTFIKSYKAYLEEFAEAKGNFKNVKFNISEYKL